MTEPNIDDTNQASDPDETKFVADSDAMVDPGGEAKAAGPAAANRPPTETALAAAVLDVMNKTPATAGGGSSVKKLAIIVIANTILAATTGALLVSALSGRGATTNVASQPAAVGATVSPVVAEPVVSSSAPVSASWSSAQTAFDEGDFALALEEFQALEVASPVRAGADPTRDLIVLRIGQCHLRIEELTEARQRLQAAASSASPSISSEASFELAIINELSQAFLRARSEAYAALAVSGSLPGRRTDQSLEFVVARSLSGMVLSMSGQADAVPWSGAAFVPPLAGMSQAQIQQRLNKESDTFNQGLISPRILRFPTDDGRVVWTVTCWRAPVGMLIESLASQANLSVHWANVSPDVQQRQVTMDTAPGSAVRICELATGSAGLIARFTGNRIIVYDPTTFDESSQRLNILSAEATSCWRRYFLRYPKDQRIAEGHFSLGVSAQACDKPLEAMREYDLIGEGFSRSAVAPRALINYGKLLIDIHDYSGAKDKLSAVLDRFPHGDQIANAYMALGEAELQAGSPGEAFDVFRKLYYLDISSASRKLACRQAGVCAFLLGDDEAAVEWLRRYLKTWRSDGGPEVARSYLLLGQTYVRQGEIDLAIGAYTVAISGELNDGQRGQACVELAELHRPEYPIKALRDLLSVSFETLSDEMKFRHTLSLARVHEAMGLPGEAARHLREKIPMVPSRDQRAQLGVELAICYQEMGELQDAYRVLTEAMGGLEDAEQGQLAAARLAEIALAMGRPEEAALAVQDIDHLRNDAEMAAAVRQSVAVAHLEAEQYDRVVSLLIDMNKDTDQE